MSDHQEIAHLRQEIERLRKVLEWIADRDVIYARHDPGDYFSPAPKEGRFAKVARAALSPPPLTEETTP